MGHLRIVDFVGLDPDENLLIHGQAREALGALESQPKLAGSRERRGPIVPADALARGCAA